MNEYKIFGRHSGWNPMILERNEDDGIVFCSKTFQPFEQRGLYKMVHHGLDKNKKPFSIAEPVLDIPYDYNGLYNLVIDSLYKNPSQHNARVRMALDLEFDNEPFDLDKLLGLVDTYGAEKINDLAVTPICKDGVDFEIIANGSETRRMRPGSQLCVQYVTGETEFQNASWVYKNRDHLVNWGITVFGATADTLEIQFTRAKN